VFPEKAFDHKAGVFKSIGGSIPLPAGGWNLSKGTLQYSNGKGHF
jgi:hypothetical protein